VKWTIISASLKIIKPFFIYRHWSFGGKQRR